MQRAAVLIGVKKTGKLQELKAVGSCIDSMEKWARAQIPDPNLVKVISDANGPVSSQKIKEAIFGLVEPKNLDQLIVYFAGHGMNKQMGEYWLLSGAPRDNQEAVNLRGSEALARWCGIPHVVLISDACRTAAEGIQMQDVSGSEIFPNDSRSDSEQAVDIFFGCAVASPSLEVKDPADAQKGYRGIYTDTMVEALSGSVTRLCEVPPVPMLPANAFVRPRPLKSYLKTQVPTNLRAKGVNPSVTQVPDARITSDPDLWLSQVAVPAAAERVVRAVAPHVESPQTVFAAAQEMLESQFSPPPAVDLLIEDVTNPESEYTRKLQSIVASVGPEFGPGHFETGCGFKVRGARVQAAYSQLHVQVLNDSLVRVDPSGKAENVLLVLSNGTGVLLPAIPDFLTSLTFDGAELDAVAYEPSDQSWRWQAASGQIAAVRSLRAVVASAAKLGAFRLGDKDAPELARRMQYLKGVDPALAVYAAYAYYDLGMRARIRDMESLLNMDLGLRLFDVSMLAGSLAGGKNTALPSFPLLSQGWPLFKAMGAKLPPTLDGIERHLVQSLWTVVSGRGLDLIRNAIAQREV